MFKLNLIFAATNAFYGNFILAGCCAAAAVFCLVVGSEIPDDE